MTEKIEVEDSILRFNHLKRYYSEGVFKFIRKYYKTFNTNMQILDVGCGHGRHLILFKQLGFINLTGVDIVRRNKRNQYAFIKQDIRKGIPVEDKFSDITICTFVLKFIEPESLEYVISELLRVTKQYLILQTRQIKTTKYSNKYDILRFFNLIKKNKEFEILEFNKTDEKIVARRKEWQEKDTVYISRK